MIHALAQLQVVAPEQLSVLEPFARPPVLGGGRPVGELIADFDLVAP